MMEVVLRPIGLGEPSKTTMHDGVDIKQRVERTGPPVLSGTSDMTV